MASAFSSASTKWRYDVFLSFRGEDTRKNFVCHLYRALHQKGIYTFKDDEKLGRGKSISPELYRAIESSRFSLVVVSENYASSSWCLEELVKILQCMDAKGQQVVPIFYNVDPSHVRKQQGTFAEAFAKHEERFVDNMEMVQRWRDALAKVATISGWVSGERDDAIFIDQIVNDILKKLDHKFSSAATELIGMNHRTRQLRFLLHLESNDVQFIGIWGMGGIGKTTIARAVYDQIFSTFEACCFLANVREETKRHNIVHLQKQLLSRIFKAEETDIGNVDMGIDCIKNRLGNLKVVIILDDVDDREQVDSLAGGHDWFGEGSRIIITTRNKDVLAGITDQIYEQEGLNSSEALRLFSRHAFKRTNICESYVELSNMVIDYTKGNPLALKILGSFLLGKTEEEWKSALERLKKIPHIKIFDVLKISFDGLNREEQDVFLDVACFLKGKELDYSVEVLRSCGYFTEIDIRVLIDRCLIYISNQQLQMHDLIAEMGWEVVRRESIKEPGRRSRLWLHEDVGPVLRTDTGTEKVEGIVLDSPSAEYICINRSAFSNMLGLRLLIFENIRCSRVFCQDIDILPSALRYISWNGYPFKWLPRGYDLTNLVVLDMPHSHIKQLWQGTQHPVMLKVLNLRFSQQLTSMPDLSLATELESLILNGCSSLLTVHHSVGYLKKLKILNLEGCAELQNMPSCICLHSIEKFILSGCRKLKAFPEISCNIEYLLQLLLDDTGIKQLPSSIENLRSLVSLSMKNCKMIEHLPNSICNLGHLKTLILSGCSKLDKLPEELGNLKWLERLEVDGTAISEIPSSICRLEQLKTLHLSSCSKVDKLPEEIGNLRWLETLEVDGTAISEIPSSICRLEHLKTLDLSSCSKLEIFPENIGNIKSLETLNVCRTAITEIPSSIASLNNLRALSLAGCNKMKAWSLHLPLHSLGNLDLSDCNLVDVTSALDCLSNLRVLSLSGNNFSSVPESIKQLLSLEYLHLARCRKLLSLPMLPPNIKQIDAGNCTSLERIANSFDNFTRLDFGMWNNGHPVVLLYNCGRLVNRTGGSFTLPVVQNFHLTETKLQERHLQEESSFTGWRQLSLCFPGKDVPRWFNHRSEGNMIDAALPLDFFTNPLRGLAICAVVGCKGTRAIKRSLRGAYKQSLKRRSAGQILTINCSCTITTANNQLCSFKNFFEWELADCRTKLPDHIFLGYSSCARLQFLKQIPSTSGTNFHDQNFSANQIREKFMHGSFSFAVSGGMEVIKTCGVHLVNMRHGSDIQPLADFGSSSQASNLLGRNGGTSGRQSGDVDCITLFGTKIKRPRDGFSYSDEASRNGSYDGESDTHGPSPEETVDRVQSRPKRERKKPKWLKDFS